MLFIIITANTQTIGSFQQSINFDEADYSFTRTLYFYVPSDYDASQAYKLVVGFRGGPHTSAGQFRDQLTFLSDSINAIIVCPENNSHFNNQEGLTKQLFRYSVDTTMAMYNIDPDFIYLTGLSYGGRHSVIVSMDTDNGEIPSLRGVIPFATGSNGHLEPNYENIADFPPACICIGLNDNANFYNVANTLHNDIQANGGVSMLNEIPNVGHTVAFATYPQEMMECINFIENQYEPSAVDNKRADLEAALKLYPNPIQDKVTIDYPQSWSPSSIYLVDAIGKTLLNFNVDLKIFDVSTLPNGTYTLVFAIERDILTKKVSIIR